LLFRACETLLISCIFDTFYYNLKATDLVEEKYQIGPEEGGMNPSSPPPRGNAPEQKAENRTHVQNWFARLTRTMHVDFVAGINLLILQKANQNYPTHPSY
jgi:hypothetical protein